MAVGNAVFHKKTPKNKKSTGNVLNLFLGVGDIQSWAHRWVCNSIKYMEPEREENPKQTKNQPTGS